MKCINCNQKIEYDEGEGSAEGYVCYECINEKTLKLKNGNIIKNIKGHKIRGFQNEK